MVVNQIDPFSATLSQKELKKICEKNEIHEKLIPISFVFLLYDHSFVSTLVYELSIFNNLPIANRPRLGRDHCSLITIIYNDEHNPDSPR